MNSFYAYSFLTGMFVGGYTNFFSKVVISGLVLYMVNPENFSIEKFNPLYQTVFEKSYPYLSKVYSFSNNIKSIENRVEVIPDCKLSEYKLSENKLPKLVVKK